MLEIQFGIRKSKVGHGRDPLSYVAPVKSGKGVHSVSFTEASGDNSEGQCLWGTW